MLDDLKIFIAEDEALIALDLAQAVEDAGGSVIGPTGSVSESLELLHKERPDVGLLDANLTDGDTKAIADYLTNRSIPFIFFTGVGITERLKRSHSAVPVYRKPLASAEIIEALSNLHSKRHRNSSR